MKVIEFHDAIVESFEITRQGTACVKFSHLPIYRRETHDTCGVWSFHAELWLIGIETFMAEGITPRDEADSLNDLVIVGPDGGRLDPTSLLRGDKILLGSIKLTWALSGATVVFRGGSVSLLLLEPSERVESCLMGDVVDDGGFQSTTRAR